MIFQDKFLPREWVGQKVCKMDMDMENKIALQKAVPDYVSTKKV